MVVTAMMTELFHVPLRGGSVLLAGLNNVLQTTNSPQNLPKDPRTIRKQLNLDPVTETFLCCPTCWALQPYCPATNNPVTQGNPNPDIPLCQDRPTPSSEICGAELWKKEKFHGKTQCTPHLTYVHQHLKDWLGRLLSRPGIEDILDEYPLSASHRKDGDFMSDIWSSPKIRNLKGPDKKPFLERPSGEARFLFGFAVDGFNPFHNKTAKQVVTSTGFWLILYNFPTHLRYQFENMCYIGSAPGPKGPTVGRLNPFIELIVLDLLEFWNPGVFFTRTHKYRLGRHSKAMMIPLTADMLAAREAAGLTSATSTYFCVGCHIDLAHIEEFDASKWPRRSHSEHMEHANEWKNADSLAHQERLATKNGVRYSPLLLLPYWKIIRYILIEPMHALDLGLAEHHCRDLLGIDLSQDGGDGTEHRVPRPPKSTPERKLQVLKLFQEHRNSPDLLKEMLKNRLVSFPVLWHLCNDLGLRVAGTRRDWFILRIKRWVSSFLYTFQL